jgi:LemA protein
MIAGIVIAVIAAIVVIWAIAAYNGLVGQRNKVEEAFSTMDVYMKKRYDLIPNVVESVKGYAAHEKSTLDALVKARSAAAAAGDLVERFASENELTGALRQLFALAESYPDLKANQNFLDLQNQLQRVEEGHRQRPQVLQRQRARIQQQGADVPLVDHRGDVPLRAQAHVRSDERGRTRERAGVVLACSGGPGARRRFDCAGGKRLPAARARGGAERLPHDAAPAPQPARGRGFPWTLVCAPSAGGRAPSRWRWRRSRSPARPRPSPIRATRTTRASQSIPTTWRLPCMPTTPSP